MVYNPNEKKIVFYEFMFGSILNPNWNFHLSSNRKKQKRNNTLKYNYSQMRSITTGYFADGGIPISDRQWNHSKYNQKKVSY